MKINYDATFTSLGPNPQTITDDSGKPMTLRSAIILACTVSIKGDEEMSILAKYKVGEIGVCADKSLPLTAEQVATLKTRMGSVFTNPVLVYMLHNELEGSGE